MHEFQRRLLQYLDALPHLSKGHHERLLRPIKQLDLDCWGELEGHLLAESMKVAVRSIAHELLDLQSLQMEAAFARCHSAEQKTLLAALVASKLPSGGCVLFRTDCGLTGISYPAAELIIIEPQAALGGRRYDFLLEHFSNPATLDPRAQAEPTTILRSTPRRVAVQCLPEAESASGQDLGTNSAVASPDLEMVSCSNADVRENPFRCAAAIFRRLETLVAEAH